ncbi:MAG: anthranilate synthase component I family protein, partial [Jatrophihabitans sp.]|uniref:anthranilate synthase component I family protein n=1 Tax=Jatrophihabitans sp. TaxID=1932789 RepID=UPI003F817D0D
MPTALDLAGVLRVLRDEPDLVCLTGAWAGGATVVARAPTRVADHLPPGPADGWWLGVLPYDGPPRLTRHDHLLVLRAGQWSVVASGPVDEADELARRLAAPPPAARPFGSGPFGGADAARHLAAVEQAIGSIRAGELYQVNVCTRLSADFTGDPVEAFLALLALRPDRAAYVRAGDRHVLSASPEVFLRRVGRTVSTRPIKGTLPRVLGADERLRRSVKDCAENVMIVDLLRNDLGRVCVTGSVRVPELCVVEPHAGVWQLVSAVEGELRADVDDASLLAATFPPGSVTGAPKHSAVAEIAALEAAPRGVYTGAIGYAGADAAEWNVAIRTFEISAGRIELGVGGGITADSVPVREWHECLHKAAPLVSALGSSVTASPELRPSASHVAGGLLETLAVQGGRPVRVVEHLARLDRSAREL